MKKINTSFLPAIAWFIISTILLCLPGSKLPKIEWLNKIWFDKWVHITMFGIMVILWCRAIAKKTLPVSILKKKFLFLSLVWLVYGIMMEWVQLKFIPNRSFDKGDILADAIGCLVGLFFSNRVYIKR
ncbi:MAG: VanZ family protein [Bacteroidota bacterium]|nr:VanZ family protein [Bacteroidota bacterium]